MPQQQLDVSLPHRPQQPTSAPFPVLALIVPIVGAIVMWAIIRSPFILMFAFLGPVMALASMGDSRHRAHKDMKKQRRQFDDEMSATLGAIDQAHDSERNELELKVPSAAVLITAPLRETERWRADVEGELLVRVGSGRIYSDIRLQDGNTHESGDHSHAKRQKMLAAYFSRKISDLRARAAVLDEAPILLDARFGIGIFGARAESSALATSIVIQLATALSPQNIEVNVTPDESESFLWTTLLPHSSAKPSVRASQRHLQSSPELGAQLEFISRVTGQRITVALADDERSLPHHCRIVVRVSGARGLVIRHPLHRANQVFIPDYTSDREARRCANNLQLAATSVFTPIVDSLPTRVNLSELLAVNDGAFTHVTSLSENARSPQSCGHSLSATIGIGLGGKVTIDLVKDGPHAIVGGTTGSGKSEVLVSWILALAANYPPSHVTFLLVDFKGGAAFAPVGDLPHTVGVLTDLDEAASRRAILSLRAELRRRERILADVVAKSIDELTNDESLPRLLIVVDEFAAMTTSFPEMHEVFSDLAARGRSLGIHLILCTQRPAGTIRDSVLANCTLRVSLRVNNAADSVAVVGNPEAARIDAGVPGRALLLRAGEGVETIQWALAGKNDARDVASRVTEGSHSMIRPWLDPLPEQLECFVQADTDDPAILFGLADIPEEQRQEQATYNPAVDGNLFVVGGHRSGKSTFLSALKRTATDAVLLPADGEGAWDTLTTVLAAVREKRAPSLILVDDLDLLLSKFRQEHEAEFVERLVSLAREAPRAGAALVSTSRSVRGRMQAIFAHSSSNLLLKMRDRQEHVLVGGEASDFTSRLAPGGGYWGGHRIQICNSPPLVTPSAVPSPPLQFTNRHVLVMVSPRPESVRGMLEKWGKVTMVETMKAPLVDADRVFTESGASPNILLGHPEAWLSSHALLGSLRSSSHIAFHDCSPMEFRSVARIRELPPPVDSPQATVVVLSPDGSMKRASLPL